MFGLHTRTKWIVKWLLVGESKCSGSGLQKEKVLTKMGSVCERRFGKCEQ